MTVTSILQCLPLRCLPDLIDFTWSKQKYNHQESVAVTANFGFPTFNFVSWNEIGNLKLDINCNSQSCPRHYKSIIHFSMVQLICLNFAPFTSIRISMTNTNTSVREQETQTIVVSALCCVSRYVMRTQADSILIKEYWWLLLEMIKSPQKTKAMKGIDCEIKGACGMIKQRASSCMEEMGNPELFWADTQGHRSATDIWQGRVQAVHASLGCVCLEDAQVDNEETTKKEMIEGCQLLNQMPSA